MFKQVETIKQQSNAFSGDSDENQCTDVQTKVNSFISELNEFKQNVAKLFSGRDLTKCLLNLSVIKETKMAEETFKKLNDQMKVANRFFKILNFLTLKKKKFYYKRS